MNSNSFKLDYLAIAIASVAGSLATNATAQVDYGVSQEVEELLTIGRQRDAAEQLVMERMEESHSVDVLSSVQISRAGDSDLASALRRVPGLTLVGGKYIYVRGLGERYSSTQLNGAQVPSPDFTRNVLPLDIIPTDLIEGLKVQKAYDASLPAAFGGGNIDIMTKGIPEDFVLTFEVGTGVNSASGDGLTNAMGGNVWGDADSSLILPTEIAEAYDTYNGNLSAENIYQNLIQTDPSASFADAQEINRQLAASLNTNFGVNSESINPDQSYKFTVGDNFYLGDDWELGVLGLGAYSNKWRTSSITRSSSTLPESIYSEEESTTNEINLTGGFNAGVRYLEDHELTFTSMFIRNTDDETAINLSNNQNIVAEEGNQLRDYTIRYEQRELFVNQLGGNHQFFDSAGFDSIDVSWYYSDARAITDVPSEVSLSARDELDVNGGVDETYIRASSSAASYKWTYLEDDVESYGWDLSLTRYFGDMEVVFAGGYDYWNKVRDYSEIQSDITTASTPVDNLIGDGIYSTPDDVFDDSNILDPSNNMQIISGTQPSASYVAVIQSDAGYGSMDLRFNENWRLNVGARWEQFQQVVLAYDPLDYTGSLPSAEEVENSIFAEDDFYPALAMTYSNFDFMGAETFQVRAAYSNTVVRPDLREVATTSFQDPITDFLVFGNPNLKPSTLDNVDLRFEWFYENGDSFTTSMFYKDITDPIEAYETSSVDGNVAVSYLNAESASVYGLELEALKDLSIVTDGLFVQGNITLADSEIDIVSSDIGLTNNTRRMNGQSEWVVNAMVGWDSMNGDFAANMVYNVFGDRIAFAGVDGSDDAVELAFHSLDLNFDYYPIDTVRVRFKAQNILGEQIEYEQDDVAIVEEEVGTTFSLSVKYAY